MTLNTPSPTFPAIALPQFENEPLPPVMPVALRHPDVPALPDVAAATHAALDRSRQLTALAAGAQVGVRFRLPRSSRDIEATARVVWSRTAQAELGLQFETVAAADQHAIDEFVERHAADTPTPD